MEVDPTQLESVLERYDQGDPTALIHALQDLQAAYRYLPAEGVRRVCEHLGVPLSKAYAVATFYKAFSLEPRGEHICRVCMGTTCHIRGAPFLVEELERLLEVPVGKTTADGRFSLETVNCVGACAMAPVVLVDDDYHDGVQPTDLPKLVGR